MLVRESTAQRESVCSVKEEESESVGRVNACCQIERDREGRGQTQRGEGGKDCECLRAQRGEERQFGLSQVERERERGRQAGSSVEPAVLHCGCKLYRLRDQWVAAAEQEGSVLVDYHVCPLNAPGCCISTRVRRGRSSACMLQKNSIISTATVLLVDVHCPGVCSGTSLLSAFAQEGSVIFFLLLKELQLSQEKGAFFRQQICTHVQGMVPALR